MIGHSSGKSFGLPTITLSRLRFGITLVIVLMVISSPVVMLSNPVFAAPLSAATGDVTAYAPSTISQGGDFTAQAVLQNVRSVQSTDIVSSKAIYEILFTTATTGAIKTLEMVFPAGTGISGAGYIERTGIGPGSFIKSGNTITYTVTNPVSIPAGTPIRFELVNVQNPPTPNSNYQITITTRDPANAIIDGSTATSPTNIRQIGTADIADNAVTTPKIADGAVTSGDVAPSFIRSKQLADGQNGWIPDGFFVAFTIVDTTINANSHVFIGGIDDTSISVNGCGVGEIHPASGFDMRCFDAPLNGAMLRYTVIDQPNT